MKKKKSKEEYPLYVQASNPTKKLLKWIDKQNEKRIVYFQSGTPPPSCGIPGKPPCVGP